MIFRKYFKSRILAAILATVIIMSMLVGCGDSATPTPLEPSPTALPTPVQTPTPTATVTPTSEPSPSPISTQEPATPDVGFKLAKSHVERDSSPDIPRADMNELVAGNNAFAFDLYQALQSEKGNLFFSPYSISTALAMTYAGARSETETQMSDTLHFSLSQDQLHPAFNAIDLQLTSQEEGGKSDEKTDFTLRIANSLWGQRDYEFLEEFLDVLAGNYGAGMRLVDFVTASEPARIAINDWVSDQTEEKIKDLIPQGAIDSMTRLVLANAIYFYADWLYPFDPNSTHDGSFALLDGEEVTVSMMSQLTGFQYAQGDNYQAVELPYVGNMAAMTIIVPDSGEFYDFENGLSFSQIEEIIANLERKQVRLSLPKFTYESDFSLAKTLKEMGMPKAFSMDADFSGMDGTKNLFISDVFHKAFVAVDEEGTEAAAATAVIISLKAVPIVDVELTIDRPFIYLIRDTGTGTILFMGRVLNPAE
ncbi:MAG: serpin family protein [Chloroflexi bacterium]|nr:serpin family protein [Chloroflexota bacterium]